MKPYFLVAYNLARLSLKQLHLGSNLNFAPIQMLSFNTKLNIETKATVKIGDRVVSDGRTVIMVGCGGELVIGDHVYFNEGAMLSCKDRLSIGSGCRFGPNVQVFDNNHIFDAVNGVSSEHVAKPVEIGKNCWLGANVVVLRGAKIGDNCVIGAGCVVSGTIPSGSLVTQNRNLNIIPIEDRK